MIVEEMRSIKETVLVLGYFGYENNQLDGQTVKTRNIYKLLESKKDSYFQNVNFFDTQRFQSNKSSIIHLLFQVAKSDLLFYLPAHNNFKYIFPLIFFVCCVFRVKIHYVVVGGWLAEYLVNKPVHRWMLSHISAIYPQTKQLVDDLRSLYSFSNVYQLNNFRFIEDFSLRREHSDFVRLVFMARVHPSKGVRTVFKLADSLILNNLLNVKIDIYGPIFKEYSEEFHHTLLNRSNVKYKGVLEPEEIYNSLMNYDLMLFPTQYFTEGFPGSILDSYLAEVPVIASKWKYAEEFIEHGVAGIVVKFGDEEAFIKETLNVLQDLDRLKKLKCGAVSQSKNYSPELAWNTLVKIM